MAATSMPRIETTTRMPFVSRLVDPRLVEKADEPAAPRDRRWIAEAVNSETFIGTFVRATFRPATFAREWTAGAKVIAPLKFVGVSAALVALAAEIIAVKSAGPVWMELIRSIGPSIFFVLLGAVLHAMYRAAGSQRSLETSLGLALYASAGPGLLVPAITVATMRAAHAPNVAALALMPVKARIAFALVIAAAALWQRIALGRAMHVTHGLRLRWTIAAILVAELSLAVLYGAVENHFHADIPLNWPHLVLWTRGSMGLMW